MTADEIALLTQDEIALLRQKDVPVEIGYLTGVLRRNPKNVKVALALLEAHAKYGQLEAFLGLCKIAKALGLDNASGCYELLSAYSIRGEIDEAFAMLDLAISLGYDDLPQLDTDPSLNNLRRDPRFQKIRAKLIEERGDQSINEAAPPP